MYKYCNAYAISKNNNVSEYLQCVPCVPDEDKGWNYTPVFLRKVREPQPFPQDVAVTVAFQAGSPIIDIQRACWCFCPWRSFQTPLVKQASLLPELWCLNDTPSSSRALFIGGAASVGGAMVVDWQLWSKGFHWG